MCFSFEISIGTGIFCWAAVIYMLRTYKLTEFQRNKVILLMIFSSMQFLDAILWYIKMAKTPLNYFVSSYLVPTLLVAQIAFNLVVVNKLSPLIYVPIVLFFAISSIIKFRGYSTASCSRWGSPIWAGTEILPFFLILFYIGVCYPYDIYNLLPLLAVPFITTGGYGSMWCAVACIQSIVLLLTYR